MASRPDIPDQTKRAVRQRCGFGCVVCGKFPYQYHHLNSWSESRDDSPENLTLLCANHHDQITRRILSHETVAKWSSNPFNLANPLTSYSRHYLATSHPVVSIGGNRYSYNFSNNPGKQFYPIFLLGYPLMIIEYEDGHILFSCVFRDKYNNVIFRIDRGELATTTSAWDCECAGRSIVIRNKPRGILLDVSFSDDGLVVDRYMFRVRNKRISITRSAIRVGAGMFEAAGNVCVGQIGICFGPPRYLPCGTYFEISE